MDKNQLCQAQTYLLGRLFLLHTKQGSLGRDGCRVGFAAGRARNKGDERKEGREPGQGTPNLSYFSPRDQAGFKIQRAVTQGRPVGGPLQLKKESFVGAWGVVSNSAGSPF